MGKQNNMRQATVFVVLGLVSLGIAIIFAWLSAIGQIILDPNTAIGAGIIMLTFFIVLAILTMMSVLFRGNARMGQPKMPDRDVITRVVRDDSSGKDFFIYGDHDDTVKELLMDDWPFPKELKDTSWHLIDERHNDVTDKLLSEFEGTAKIIFD